MNNSRYQIRASGDHATYEGRDYFGHRVRERIWLLSDDDPLLPGFEPSWKDWIRAERLVPIDELQRLSIVKTSCVWRGHPFEVGIIVGDFANVIYLGKNFDDVSQLPGMRRPDKYEVRGRAPVSELTEIKERVEEVPPVHNPTGRGDELR